jgi:chromatin remodeling complex protein RSC6
MILKKKSTLPRNEAAKKVCEYIKVNKLYDEKDKRNIFPDSKLRKLLGDDVHLLDKKRPELGKGVRYFNLQTYLKPHFLGVA